MSVKAIGFVFDLEGLDPTDKFVLLAYVDHADHDGKNIYPAVNKIAKKTGYTRRTVQRSTKELERLGLLMPEGKGPRGTNKWKLNMEWQGVTERQGDNETGGGVPESPPGAYQSHPRGVPGTPEPSITVSTTVKEPILPSEGANAPPVRGNGASPPVVDLLPTNLESWLNQVNSPPKGSNVNAQLRLMYQTLFPDNPLPSFGRVGTTAKRVGGPARLGQLMWEAATKRPVGCVLDYIEATEKARKKRNEQRQSVGRRIKF